MAVIAAGFRQPGEIDSKSGIGNDDFNAGRLVAKFAYKLEQVYQLNNPVSLDVMKRNGWTGPPRRYDYLPPAVVGSLLGNLRCALFEDASEAGLDQPDLKVSGSRDVPSGGTLSSRGSTAGDAGTLTTAQSIAAGTQYPGANVNANEDMSISQEIEAQLLSDISETQISRNLQPSTLLSSQAQTAAHAPSTSHLPWPSQVTTATVLSTQESPGRARSQLHDTESIPDAELVVVLRPELEPEQASVTFTKDGCADRAGLSDANYASQWQNNLQRRHSRARDRRLRPLFQPDMVSSGDSTQAALPDSLYEEVRQAPPAVILDSEDSDDEE
ncbi:hypothetical protein SBRCBS47491_010120 [Sporothrix bragantina]|uniref:Uncharacterized protein n=1 Tax=Sporothrix bragantina TaxID=671064 RepID=A0ABP0D028_9PEZI